MYSKQTFYLTTFVLTLLFVTTCAFESDTINESVHNNKHLSKVLINGEIEVTRKAPVIGVITQLLRDYKRFSPDKKLHLPSSYVKWIEAAGGQVLPILLNQDDYYYEHIFNSTNALLFPGGDNMLDPSIKTPMLEAAKKLYKLAVDANTRGDLYPIWGTCLGFELLSVLTANKNVLFDCETHDVMLPVIGVERGKLFSKAKSTGLNLGTIDYSNVVYNTLQKDNLTYNYHRKCLVDNDDYIKSKLDSFYRILGYSYDKKNRKFITMFEAKEFPFFGVQFHPEKAPFEFTSSELEKSVSHSKSAIEVSRYFADFFVNLASMNKHKQSPDIQTKLIYIYNATYTGPSNDMYLQRYLFPFVKNEKNVEIEFIYDDDD